MRRKKKELAVLEEREGCFWLGGQGWTGGTNLGDAQVVTGRSSALENACLPLCSACIFVNKPTSIKILYESLMLSPPKETQRDSAIPGTFN